jgi:hypothetical protein
MNRNNYPTQNTTKSENPVKAKLARGFLRTKILPTLFGPKYLLGEEQVYRFMQKFCRDNTAGTGYWNFYVLDNGGYFMAPKTDQRFHLVVASNGYEGEMSAEAAGIVVTLFTLCYLSEVAYELEDAALLARINKHFYALNSYADGHPEWKEIYGATD